MSQIFLMMPLAQINEEAHPSVIASIPVQTSSGCNITFASCYCLLFAPLHVNHPHVRSSSIISPSTSKQEMIVLDNCPIILFDP
jgi:hypothetical protein